MQPMDVIRTIKWIESIAPKEVIQGFFEGALVRHPTSKSNPDNVLSTTHALSVLAERVHRNPDAISVLQAFQLLDVLDPTYIVAFSKSALNPERVDSGDHFSHVVWPWRAMVNSVVAWEGLTVPPELRAGKIPDSIISIEMRPSEVEVTLETVTSAFRYLDSAYAAIGRVYMGEANAQQKLDVVSIHTGSPTVRIDCKGLAGLVKELKLFLIEAWHKIRHKRTEELIERNSALLGTLGVVEVIERQRQQGGLGAEDAENLKRTLVDSALGLFGCNGLPTEIRRRESVDNDKLLSSFSPKLLTAGKEGSEVTVHNDPEGGTRPPRKRKPRRGRQKPATPPVEIPSLSVEFRDPEPGEEE